MFSVPRARSRFRHSSVVDETHMRGAPAPTSTRRDHGQDLHSPPCPYYLTTYICRSIPMPRSKAMLCGLHVQVRRRAR